MFFSRFLIAAVLLGINQVLRGSLDIVNVDSIQADLRKISSAIGQRLDFSLLFSRRAFAITTIAGLRS